MVPSQELAQRMLYKCAKGTVSDFCSDTAICPPNNKKALFTSLNPRNARIPRKTTLPQCRSLLVLRGELFLDISKYFTDFGSLHSLLTMFTAHVGFIEDALDKSFCE